MAELKFGDLIVNPSYKDAVLLYWGIGKDEDGNDTMIVTILRKEPVWQPSVYAIGTAHTWGYAYGWKRVDRWPD